MQAHLAKAQAYTSIVAGHWKLLLTIFSIASLAYTVHIYSRGAAQVNQPDEYMKTGPTAPQAGPFDWVKTLLIAGALGTLILIVYYYAGNWGWLNRIRELVRVRASTIESIG